MNNNVYIMIENDQKKFMMSTDKTYVIPVDCKIRNISISNANSLLNNTKYQDNTTNLKNTKENNCLICLIPFGYFHKYTQLSPKKYTSNFKICPEYSNLVILANGKRIRKNQKNENNEYLKEIVKNIKNKKIKRYNSVLDKFKVIKEKKVNINNNGLNENYLDDEIIKFSKPISNYYKIHKKKYHNSSTYDKTIDNNTSKKSLQNKRNTVEEIPKNLELKIIKQIDYKKLLDKKESENKKQDNNDENEKRKSNSGDGLENELYNNKSFKNPFSISGMKNSKYKNDRYNEKYSLHYFSKINNDSI